MARGLSAALDAVMLGERREPAFIVEIFDIRSTSSDPTPTTINDVVLFNLGLGGPSLPVIVGPRDFTDDILQVEVTEIAGDYVQQGISSSGITILVSDPTGDLDPVDNPAPANGRWLRQGNVIVVREGDSQVPVAQFETTFTGRIQGQPGQDFNRTTQTAEISARATSREVDFLRRENTTRNFTQSTPFQTIAEEIAETDMGLDVDEINLPTFGVRLTKFTSTQFVMESPLTSIAKLMFPDGFMPRFAGDGRLDATSGAIGKGATRTYAEFELPVTIRRPILEFNGTNSVEILGLDSELTKVTQERQLIAEAGITTGFFSREIEIPVAWSEDLTQQAENLSFVVLNSVGDSPIAFGSEEFAETVQSDGGSVRGDITVDGSIAAGIALIGLIIGAWIGSLFIFDVAPPGGGGVAPTGRSVTVFAGKAIMLILGQTGRGEYRIIGIPYEYVFQELRAVARIAGIRSEDRQEVTVENHLLNTQADVDETAERVLRRERAKQNLRSIEMIHDLKLEPDDVFAVGTGLDERRYMIQSIQRRLLREGPHIATLHCFEVTAGVRP